MKLYNTLTQQKEIFSPIEKNRVRMYVCGVTVYDYCHLGHGRCYMTYDVFMRFLRYLGYDVLYVRNITDVDDKIIRRAREEGKEAGDVARAYTRLMHEDFQNLGLLKPHHEPKATEHISNMIRLIEELIEKKHAYTASNKDVYFSVESFSQYACLSHHRLSDLEAGARVEVVEEKRNPLDFALWKHADDEPLWDSPWGKGRPGWHIECSAMSRALLGETFDVHGGGRDLIFPHHENELAQSEACSGKQMVSYWMHTGFLQINEEKMSKSLGNFLRLCDVLKEYGGEVLRLFFIGSHYRSPLVFSSEHLFQTRQSLSRLYSAIRYFDLSLNIETHGDYEQRFKEAMEDDLNTPIALSVLFELAHDIQKHRETDAEKARVLACLLKKLAGILGLLESDPELYFQAGVSLSNEDIERIIAEREAARKARDWKRSDALRDQLLKQGIVLEDSSQGTTWRKG